ncbi:MAG: PilZ domain-containing protein [Candidatus Omnitrophica bacterium]|nr:PilZ domain-containing protein [Candidatus Omnitrophota bacterium]MBU1996103.1 PilZ domain-containing protein [Candidatus Omnitrophota bacterium]MBU4333100.1 PilZ domain-containing protein [Candidatus Omnitrophota bacterium]
MYSAYRTDRRRFKRMRVRLAAVYRIEGPEYVKTILDDGEFEARTVDVSEGGLSLLAEHYLPRKTIIRIKLIVFEIDNSGSANFYEPVTAIGNVRSVNQWDNDEYRLGVYFQDISQEHQKRLSDIVNSSLKKEILIST